MRRSNQITALVILAALVAVAVGVAVWPTPEEARATNVPCKVTVNWGGFCAPYNIVATAELLDAQGEPLEGWFAIQLEPDENMTTFSGIFGNVPTEAVSVRFDWDAVAGYNFNPQPVQIVAINWGGTTSIATNTACNGR